VVTYNGMAKIDLGYFKHAWKFFHVSYCSLTLVNVHKSTH